MTDKQVAAPDSTAVRVALRRVLHVEVDPPPHVLEDEVGLKLAAPEEDWRSRPDMSPFTRPFRASIVARARFHAFNRTDVDALAALYASDAVNHQAAESPVPGRDAIRAMFVTGFATTKMICVVENIFEDGEG